MTFGDSSISEEAADIISALPFSTLQFLFIHKLFNLDSLGNKASEIMAI